MEIFDTNSKMEEQSKKNLNVTLRTLYACAHSSALIHENILVYFEIGKVSSSIHTALELLFRFYYPQAVSRERKQYHSKDHEMIQICMYIKLAKENYVCDGKNVEQTKNASARDHISLILKLVSSLCSFIYSFHRFPFA